MPTDPRDPAVDLTAQPPTAPVAGTRSRPRPAVRAMPLGVDSGGAGRPCIGVGILIIAVFAAGAGLERLGALPGREVVAEAPSAADFELIRQAWDLLHTEYVGARSSTRRLSRTRPSRRWPRRPATPATRAS